MKKLLTILIILFSLKGKGQALKPFAGNDTTITLPANSVTFHGTATGGTPSYKYHWAKIGTLQSGDLVSPNSQTCVFKKLHQGINRVQLTVTDRVSTKQRDTIVVTVNGSGASLIANAGADQTQGRFQGYSLLNGSGSTGTITASNWQLISPTSPQDGVAYIDDRTSLSTSTHLMPYGNYSYQLTVTNSTLTKTISHDEVNQPQSVLTLNNVTSLSNGMIVFGQFIKGNTTITNISGSTITLSNPIIYPVYTGEVLTFATGSGDISKDTTNITVNWQTALPPQRINWHRVTSGTLAADRVTCPFCNVADFIIDGANDGFNIGGFKTDIYVPAGTLAGQAAGTTIFIKAGIYGQVNFDCSYGDVIGTSANHIKITNYAGQVQTFEFRFNNISYCTVTGQYVNGVSGDPRYKGWDSTYTFPEGTFGLFANNGWQSVQSPDFGIVGRTTGNTVTYVEGGNGGFAGIEYKDGDGVHNFDSVNINHCLFYMTGGEGAYFGQTSDDPNSLFDYLDYNNNVHAFTGNEAFQIGQLASHNKFHNNVAFGGATRWRSAFEESQYFNDQFGIRNGDNYIDSNIFIGAGEQLQSALAYKYSGLPYNNGNLYFYSNTWQYSKGFIANFLAGINGFNFIGMKMIYDSCVFGNSYFQENKVFNQFFPGTSTPVPNYTNTQQTLRASVDSNLVVMHKSYKDNTKTQLISNAATIDTSGTTTVSQLPIFDWNSGFDSSNMRTYSMWGNWIFASLGDEFTNQTPFQQGQKNIFQQNDMVMWLSKFYTSNINNNWNHMPNGTDAYWTQKTYNNNGTTVTTPPLDFRLTPTNFYYLRGMGITAHQ